MVSLPRSAFAVARRLIWSRQQDAGRPKGGHHLQSSLSVYAKSRSFRKLDDVAQGTSYICGMTVADPLVERRRGGEQPLNLDSSTAAREGTRTPKKLSAQVRNSGVLGGPWGNLLQHKHAGRSPRDVAAEAAVPRPPTRPALALTRLRMIDHGRRIRGERPGLFEPQVGLVIALKQLWSDHELPGCSGRDMAPGGERPRGNAVPSGGAPVEQRLADWRREALADRSKRPKSSPWRVPAEVEALVCELCRHPTRARRGTTRVATVREWNSARSPTATVRETGEQARPSMGATC